VKLDQSPPVAARVPADTLTCDLGYDGQCVSTIHSPISLPNQTPIKSDYSSGSGVIKSSSTTCYEILDQVRKLGEEIDGPGLVLRVNPEIARALKEEEAGVLRELKETLRKQVTLKSDSLLHHEQFDVMAL